MLTGAYKMQRMASPLSYLEQYHKDGEFLNHFMRVTCGETWVSFVNVDAHTFTKHTEEV
jgi:hypothetical protein